MAIGIATSSSTSVKPDWSLKRRVEDLTLLLSAARRAT
jgi:hypothetical protein